MLENLNARLRALCFVIVTIAIIGIGSALISYWSTSRVGWRSSQEGDIRQAVILHQIEEFSGEVDTDGGFFISVGFDNNPHSKLRSELNKSGRPVYAALELTDNPTRWQGKKIVKLHTQEIYWKGNDEVEVKVDIGLADETRHNRYHVVRENSIWRITESTIPADTD